MLQRRITWMFYPNHSYKCLATGKTQIFEIFQGLNVGLQPGSLPFSCFPCGSTRPRWCLESTGVSWNILNGSNEKWSLKQLCHGWEPYILYCQPFNNSVFEDYYKRLKETVSGALCRRLSLIIKPSSHRLIELDWSIVARRRLGARVESTKGTTRHSWTFCVQTSGGIHKHLR